MNVPLSERPFNVLTVCTGNICRSPIAEDLLRSRLQALGIQSNVHSAGSSALVGRGMTPEAMKVAHRYGGAGENHEARQLTQELAASADLILTATREHRGAVVGLHPRAARYSFTLNQFARLVDPVLESGFLQSAALENSDGKSGRLRSFVAEVAATRGYFPPPENLMDDDIEDPYRQPWEVYERVGARVDAGVGRVVRAFAIVSGRK